MPYLCGLNVVSKAHERRNVRLAGPASPCLEHRVQHSVHVILQRSTWRASDSGARCEVLTNPRVLGVVAMQQWACLKCAPLSSSACLPKSPSEAPR